MIPRSYKTEGIILARRNFGEADKILTILTRYHGKIRAVAKGVRKTTSRKRGSLELFNSVIIFLVKGKTFDIITEAEVVDGFGSWRRDLLRVGIAYHLAEVVNKLTREGQEAKEVYQLLTEFYTRLSNKDLDVASLVDGFKKRVLTELGFLSSSHEVVNLDHYIEELSQSKLKTSRFLKSFS